MWAFSFFLSHMVAADEFRVCGHPGPMGWVCALELR